VLSTIEEEKKQELRTSGRNNGKQKIERFERAYRRM
jgi:hypothetical protein